MEFRKDNVILVMTSKRQIFQKVRGDNFSESGNFLISTDYIFSSRAVKLVGFAKQERIRIALLH
jgi:hypothetical protein